MSELKLQQCRLDGRYDVLDCLGRGAYSEVYVARDAAAIPPRPRTVVIKALNAYLQGSPDPDLERTLVENFRNEAIALDRVRHPNVIARLGHGTAIDLQDRTFHYLVLEYLPGGDLQALCRKGPVPIEGALHYLEQVSAGLSHAHSRGVIHRDIKPQNLLLTADQHTVKIADFGVAKIEAAEGSITRVGTDLYAAPEHHPLMATGPLDTGALRPRVGQLTPAADVYSLAKTAYMLLTGESPRPFSQRPIKSLPEELAAEPWAAPTLAVLERATRTNPEKRYQSVEEFWRELREATRSARRVAPAPPPSRSDDRGPNGVEPVPPPAPAFDRVARAPAESSRHRIVVPIAAERGEIARAQSGRAPETAAQTQTDHYAYESREPGEGSRLRALLVAAVLLLAFSGMLYATYRYVSNRRAAQADAQPARPGAPSSPSVGREFLTKTDVHLRGGPATSFPRVGLAESGSRVRVVNSSGRWYEVEILQHGRAKADPNSAERGWLNSTFLKTP
jgi:serine/threonine protein kinase